LVHYQQALEDLVFPAVVSIFHAPLPWPSGRLYPSLIQNVQRDPQLLCGQVFLSDLLFLSAGPLSFWSQPSFYPHSFPSVNFFPPFVFLPVVRCSFVSNCTPFVPVLPPPQISCLVCSFGDEAEHFLQNLVPHRCAMISFNLSVIFLLLLVLVFIHFPCFRVFFLHRAP